MRDVLSALMLTGAICIAATSPYFGVNLVRYFSHGKKYEKNGEKKVCDVFYRLRREGCIQFDLRDKQLYVTLTERGRKKAGRFQIDSLEVKKPLRWDKKWRLVIFDIPNSHGIKRSVFRGKLKELGFYQLQKSVWVHPYNCHDEIELLREFFGLNRKEIRLVVASDIGDSAPVKEAFRLK